MPSEAQHSSQPLPHPLPPPPSNLYRRAPCAVAPSNKILSFTVVRADLKTVLHSFLSSKSKGIAAMIVAFGSLALICAIAQAAAASKPNFVLVLVSRRIGELLFGRYHRTLYQAARAGAQ